MSKETNTSDQQKITPMIKQYLEIRARYPKHVLFYRLGDFYEMFYEDAEKISKELELTLTSRAGVPMCGVPHHAAQGYVKRLLDKGFRVAVCEQMGEATESKSIVEREVVRVLTPGTVVEEEMLQEDKNNYILCVYREENSCGMVFADVSTGEFHLYEKNAGNEKALSAEIIAEIVGYSPVELLYNENFVDLTEVGKFLRSQMGGCLGDMFSEEKYAPKNDNELIAQFITEDSGQIPTACPLVKKALLALFGYINETYKSAIPRSVKLYAHGGCEYMELSLTTRRNLELTETMRNKDRRGSLLWVLDRTKTGMGKRRLKQYIAQPLMDPVKILARLNSVEELASDITRLDALRDELGGIYDIERLVARIVYKVASLRDLFSLGSACGKLPALKKILSEYKSPLLVTLCGAVDLHEDITTLIQNAIVDNPPALTKDGGYIKDGFNAELDRLRLITGGCREVLDDIERREREQTGIKTLRVGYNRVFGYYIEVSKGAASAVPERYIRKQTLSTGERYITEELKEIEHDILSANDKILKLEAEIFAELRRFVTDKAAQLQRTADALSDVDVLESFALAAIEQNYTKPDISLDSVIEIREGRHPVIEAMLTDAPFAPNDTFLDVKNHRLMMITGPNMSGKSTFMRQTALITLMAQIGSFVPARSARIGVVDKIFTRVGASDDLSAGQSTFMVEMKEVAEILKNATKKSLVILDEIGRGTSTFDGISIAKAVAEYINSKSIGCKTLFATHYHELTALESTNPGIKNYSVAVLKKGDDISFLHKIVEGGTDDSYGIEVAKLAGVPQKVINAAKAALSELELSGKIDLERKLTNDREQRSQMQFEEITKNEIIQRIRSAELDDMTPREAFTLLEDMKKMLK